jgi:hypothetical protein
MGEMSVLNSSGDTKVIWDPKNEDETEVAEEQFDALTKKGFTAFKVDKKGDAAGKMTKFDPNAGKIILVPQIAGG